MRARSVVSVIAVLLTGIALKLALFGPTQVAAVSSFKSSGLDIELMHQGAKVSPRRGPSSRIVFEREMVCSLICKQMSKRDDGYGSVRSGAATTVDHCREASDRGGESGAWGQCCRGCSTT